MMSEERRWLDAVLVIYDRVPFPLTHHHPDINQLGEPHSTLGRIPSLESDQR
jgi:hypothetical protein